MPMAPGMEATDSPLRKWETAVDRAIREAQERGAFDRLPGHGKPLDLTENPYAGDWAVAFRVLDNAGVAPLWMELNREIVARRADLAARIEAAREGHAAWSARLARPAQGVAPSPPAPPAQRWPRWWQHVRRWLWIEAQVTVPDRITPDDVTTWADRMERARGRYLARAAELDQTVRHHNAALPAPLGHLEHIRLTPDRAGRDFDAAWHQLAPLAADDPDA